MPNRPQVTPQVPVYISSATAMSLYDFALMDDLHKRLGELRNDVTLLNDSTGEVFGRYIGSDFTYKSNVNFNKFGYDFDMKMNAVQLGVNLFHLNTDKNDVLRGGVAWTYGTSKVEPEEHDGYGKGDTDSNNLGLFVTWQRESGLYVDGVLQFGFHRSDISGAGYGDVNKLKGNSWALSVEAGYPWKLDNEVVIEPQAQLMFQNMHIKDSTDATQALIRYDDYNQTIGRIGVRVHRNWVSDNGNQHTPYARLNYYHAFGSAPKVNISDKLGAGTGYNFTGGKFGQAFQIGLGLTSTFKNNFSLYGEIDYQTDVGSSGVKGLRWNIGGKWEF